VPGPSAAFGRTRILAPAALSRGACRRVRVPVACPTSSSHVCPAVPISRRPGGLDSRDQARRLPHHGRARPRQREALHPERLRAAALRKLPVRSCVIDREAIVCDANGLAVFDLLRRWGGNDVVLCAFDLLELDGHDLRRAPIEKRKVTLAKLLRPSIDGIAFNEHYSGDGAIIYKHACALGCEGIV
jgi:hypothetical protein